TARLCALYSIELPMPVLFATPTIAGVAEVIERKTAEQPNDAGLEAYLSAIEALTDEEAERLLADASACAPPRSSPSACPHARRKRQHRPVAARQASAARGPAAEIAQSGRLSGDRATPARGAGHLLVRPAAALVPGAVGTGPGGPQRGPQLPHSR